MNRKICIITPGTIASNPRVVKEAEALSEAGYKVHLIYTRHVNYLIDSDEAILMEHPEWTYDFLDWAGSDLKAKILKYSTGLIKKISSFLLKFDLYSAQLTPILINRFYAWQLKKAIDCKADLYIAHYPDSLAIAARAAKINKALFAYDAEDFHRGEDIPQEMIKAVSLLENRLLKLASYISAASPLIAEEYRKLVPDVKVVSVENMFPSKNQTPFVELSHNPIKFFWFSQTIGPKRGLEEFISIIKLLGIEYIQLTLLGNCDNHFKTQLQKKWLNSSLNPESLNFVETLPEKDIFRLAATHHFGLALEIPYSINRNICLTNKIYTYILSGNFLILSKTKAQVEFHRIFPDSGISIDLNQAEESAKQVLSILNNPVNLNEKRLKNFDLGQSKLNFDQEKKILFKELANLWN
ncbi:glycosyltransferase family protein [Daejeonella oryzae]|uniref:hypothetical protein n=1 Tax=Daejeonella oryzae TaxID=1122943 RepID=UPI00047DCB69|nr:hypothetical protein [Daejeonella oryzae]